VLRLVAAVAVVRGVEWQLLFSPRRECERVASARAFAMALCACEHVPLCHIARAFGRDWSTVYSAEQTCARRYRQSAAFRTEWDSIATPVVES
jgi:chromosomal replication initiation ATPase DnaA